MVVRCDSFGRYRCIWTHDINMAHWYSCQIDYRTIFQVNVEKPRCRALTIESAVDKFRKHKLPDYPGKARQGISPCKISYKHALIVGGAHEETEFLNSCLRFDLSRQEWEPMPSMNVARVLSSSCVLGDHRVFVFCGMSSTGFLQSIEVLQIRDSASEQMREAWQLVPLNLISELTPRSYAVVCPVNQSEILVMGGYYDGFKDDVYVFDASEGRIQKVTQAQP